MDDDSLRNWGYYEPSLKGHLGLQLMPSVVERDTKPFISGRDSPLMVTEPPVTHMDYVRDSWINHRERFLHMFPGNAYNPALTESYETYGSLLMPQSHQPDESNDVKPSVAVSKHAKETGDGKKRSGLVAPKMTKAKKRRKSPVMKENGDSSVHRAKTAKKKVDIVINGMDFDISGMPIPVCSCTGTPQQCYRWGCGSWQSACCTMTISMYPLPMSTKRRGARIAGRKMSQGAFKKVLEKLASEGYDFSNSIDLRTYWAKHGTNKFVTIR